MTTQSHPQPGSRDIIVGWSAFGAAALAVFAWSACCVLPLALSIAGFSLAGTAAIAGQRTWLTLGTVVVLGAGWWMVWRRRQSCAVDAACAPPSRLMIGLLSGATLLTLAALAWGPFIEPWALALLRNARG
jgi:mercuric ion transport protein